MQKLKLAGLSILSGLLMGVAWPETGGVFLLFFVALTPLLYIEYLISKKENTIPARYIFLFAYIAFFTFLLYTCWWIYFASAGGMIMVVVIYSAFMATTFYWFHTIKKRLGENKGYFGLIAIWLAFEWLHSHWEFSHPWNSFGNVFANQPELIQWYEYTGLAGGTFWILLVNILIFQFLKRTFIQKETVKKNKLLVVGILALIIIPASISYNTYNSYQEQGEAIEVVIIQPNIDPYFEKFNGMTPEEQMQRILDLTREKITPNTKYIVAPETAIPHSFNENEIEQIPTIIAIRTLLNEYPNATFIIGATSYIDYPASDKKPSATARKNKGSGGWYDVYNSAVQISHNKTPQIYHKSKLVLGTEKVPYPEFFAPFEKFAIDLGGSMHSLGEEKEAFNLINDSIQIAPVICYESIFGDYVSSYINKGADAIFIMTNDGWWEDTPGYRQHLAYARVRAIENRRSIARSANTGSSAFINQRGDLSQKTNWWEAVSIIETIQLNKTKTYYTQNGDYLGRIAGFIAVLMLLWSWRLKFMPKK